MRRIIKDELDFFVTLILHQENIYLCSIGYPYENPDEIITNNSNVHLSTPVTSQINKESDPSSEPFSPFETCLPSCGHWLG